MSKAKSKTKPRSAPPRQPANAWDMQIGESSVAYAAFVCYRDLGADRSLELAAQKLNKSKTNLAKWSSNHRWTERTREWDAAEQQRRDTTRAADERKVWKEAQIEERDRRKKLLNRMGALLGASINEHVTTDANGKPTATAPDPEQLRSIAGAFKTYMEQSRQEFNDLPTQKVAPVDARDPEGETPYAPRLDDFTSVITAVKELLESERGDDD